MPDSLHPTDSEPLEIADYRSFYIPGEYVDANGGKVMSGGMFVENFTPARITHENPVVMVHGNWQTGSNYTGTPDGRRGWAQDFLRAGYRVYVVDQPGRGRSGDAGTNGGREGKTAEFVQERFTGGNDKGWPQGETHSQWPGTGEMSETIFDRHFASQVESLTDRAATERLNLAANLKLAEQIGPAIWITHSQSGPFGMALADARPEAVAALISIEPNGPAFRDCLFTGEAEAWFRHSDAINRPYGIAQIPLKFDPPLAPGETLEAAVEDTADREGLIPCHLQAEPVRMLPNLRRVRHAILVGEASYHAPYDHCTAKFLSQAGAPPEFIRLETQEIHGNGHMMMLEENNHVIADLMLRWLDKLDL